MSAPFGTPPAELHKLAVEVCGHRDPHVSMAYNDHGWFVVVRNEQPRYIDDQEVLSDGAIIAVGHGDSLEAACAAAGDQLAT